MFDLLPFLLVVVAGFSFATAAILQHRVVAAASSAVRLRDVTRSSVWWLGLLLATGGSVLHAGALVLAPLSIVQPVGVLAMPIAVLLAAAHTRRKPTTGMLAGVMLSSTSVILFVMAALDQGGGFPASDGKTALGAGAVLMLVTASAGIGLVSAGWVRCLACAMAGGAAFGLVAALMRTASQAIAVAGIEFFSPTILAVGTAMVTATLTGGWLVQQAFACGPPEVVVACLTAVDPIVAVLFGLIVLGEGHPASVAHWAVLVTAATGAIVGIAALARYHPDALSRSDRTHFVTRSAIAPILARS
jgi:hypothetical protein